MNTTPKPVRERMICYDVIRVFSCFCILAIHFNAAICGYNGTFVYPNNLIPNYYLGGRLYLGDIGVSLFFMLSGATLMHTYRDVRTFYKKRFQGIFPMFWLTYLLVSAYDLLQMKAISDGNLWLLLPSILGMDGYLCVQGLIGFDFYKIGEWFLGCILLLYLIFPLLYTGVKKHPVLTVALSLLIYGLFQGKVHSVTFFLRIPEMLFGMLSTQYHLEKKPWKFLKIGGGLFAAVHMLQSFVSPMTYTIAACGFLFSILAWISQWVCRGTRLLTAVSGLTYPAFLIHHWLIPKLIQGFVLDGIPRRTVVALFFTYLIIVIIASKVLTVCTAYVMKWIGEFYCDLKKRQNKYH